MKKVKLSNKIEEIIAAVEKLNEFKDCIFGVYISKAKHNDGDFCVGIVKDAPDLDVSFDVVENDLLSCCESILVWVNDSIEQDKAAIISGVYGDNEVVEDSAGHRFKLVSVN